jgi:hypothetical protein
VNMAAFVNRLRIGPAVAACRKSPLVAHMSPAARFSWPGELAVSGMVSRLGAPSASSVVSRLCHGLSNEQEEQEIYRGILATQIKLVKTFSLCTSLVGTVCSPILASSVADPDPDPA